MSSFSHLHGSLYSFTISHLSNHNNIWIFSHCSPQSSWKTSCVISYFSLRKYRFIIFKYKFYRIFYRKYMLCSIFINFIPCFILVNFLTHSGSPRTSIASGSDSIRRSANAIFPIFIYALTRKLVPSL